MLVRWIPQLVPFLEAMEAVLFLVLAGLLVAVPWVFVTRMRRLGSLAGDSAHWVGLVGQGLREGSDPEALALADGGRSLPGRLAAFALSHPHLCPDALERLLEAREIEDRREIERGISFLGTVGANAPFVGLTGTVLGILAAFQHMAGTGGPAGGAVLGSIAGSLVATAAGLFVAIPAVVLHNVLQHRVDWILEESRQLRVSLVARSLQGAALAADA